MRSPWYQYSAGMSTVSDAGSKHWPLRNCVQNARQSLAQEILGGYSCKPLWFTLIITVTLTLFYVN